MKTGKLFGFTLLALVLAGLICTRSEAQTQSYVPIIVSHFKAMSAHDTLGIARNYAKNAQLRSPNWEGAKIGPAAEMEIYRRYFDSATDLDYHITRIIDNHSVLVVEYSATGTMRHVEDAASVYMIGKTYTLQCCGIFTFKNGKIISETTYFDQVAFLRQMGFFDRK